MHLGVERQSGVKFLSKETTRRVRLEPRTTRCRVRGACVPLDHTHTHTNCLVSQQEEESAPSDPSSSPSNKEDDSQDTRTRASSQTSQNSPPLGRVGTGNFSQAASAFTDQQGIANLRLDDETEYPPLTVHND